MRWGESNSIMTTKIRWIYLWFCFAHVSPSSHVTTACYSTRGRGIERGRECAESQIQFGVIFSASKSLIDRKGKGKFFGSFPPLKTQSEVTSSCRHTELVTSRRKAMEEAAVTRWLFYCARISSFSALWVTILHQECFNFSFNAFGDRRNVFVPLNLLSPLPSHKEPSPTVMGIDSRALIKFVLFDSLFRASRSRPQSFLSCLFLT